MTMLQTLRLSSLVRRLNVPAQQHRVAHSLLRRTSPSVSSIPTVSRHVESVACYTTTTEQQPSKSDDQSNRVTKFKPITAPTMGEMPKLYKELIKAKLAGLVALTTMSGYAMAPGAATVSTLLFTTIGTALCISSANAINQWIEVPYDAQMLRTRNRVLGRRQLSQFHAFSFGMLTGTTGVATLATMVNPLTAALGAANILLYTAVYTPMKRASIANTWAGAVVGAIPPMMGWAAVTNSLEPGAWALGAILYAWQFPHFNALAWNLRADYSKAGYRMMSVTDPKLNARVSLRYSLAMVPLCLSMPYLGLTSWLFAVDSTIVNAGLIWGAVKFWRHSNEKSARQLFFGSVIHLPVLLALMMVHKVYDADPEESLAFEYVDEIVETDEP
ncbi:Protoheme IX farnesyltransferase, mitochondrial [Apophysomyces sp. BC1034]|nr:Protoheme IX farnesyltransferase, mitochondrial [Apophysomyces sp. BC1015]KAG0180466.1 Protoheme IX farnesyltransferase, mitochondrial [Apophysomyces sp. BC1021]KAG0191028.1 Protoheme IX farnesyltransferase, mitochondrial [Apophysomyces sp. BC1034]